MAALTYKNKGKNKYLLRKCKRCGSISYGNLCRKCYGKHGKRVGDSIRSRKRYEKKVRK
jgi:hypothetical protein